MLRTLAIVHQDDAGPGVFAEVTRQRGWDLQRWMIAEGAPAPAEPLEFDAVIVFGGAVNVDETQRHSWLVQEKALLRRLLDARIPLLGVCLGAQLLADAVGASVSRAPEPEIGWYDVAVSEPGALDPLLGPLAPQFTAFEWHSYAFPLPVGAVALASSPVCLQAFRLPGCVWGIQFHAEVTLENLEHWLDDHHRDPDAVRMQIDPDTLRDQTERAIAGWNAVGRGICQRFLDVAAARE